MSFTYEEVAEIVEGEIYSINNKKYVIQVIEKINYNTRCKGCINTFQTNIIILNTETMEKITYGYLYFTIWDNNICITLIFYDKDKNFQISCVVNNFENLYINQDKYMLKMKNAASVEAIEF